MLAAVTVLWGGGTLFFGGDSVSAILVESSRKDALMKILAGQTDNLSQAQKDWFVDTFYRIEKRPEGMLLSSNDVVLSSLNGNPVLGGNNKKIGGSWFDPTVYGSENITTGSAYVFGHSNMAMAPAETIAVGTQNRVFGGDSIAIGTYNLVLPIPQDDLTTMHTRGIAIGTKNVAQLQSVAMGVSSIATGTSSIAVGSNAIAGKISAEDYTTYFSKPGSWHYAEYLQKNYAGVFGTYDANQTEEDRMKVVDPILFEQFKSWFDTQGISSYEKLVKEVGPENSHSKSHTILRNLGWQYALTQDNIMMPTAIGYQAKATLSNSVALGSYSRFEASDMVTDETVAPYSNVMLSTKGTEVNGINEYLLGPVSVGGKKEGNTAAINLRQIKYVADGTADTDAVNLRQLKAAVGSSGNSGGGDNNGGSGNSGSSIVYEAGDNITITDKGADGHTKVISATGITDIKNQVTNLNGRVDKVEDSMNTMSHRITKLDRRVDKVGAGAAALAALHPLDFDPDNKWDIAGGYGHYAGQSAMALGAYYRPNEDVMFSIGGAFGNGEDMINAGVSVKVGSGESKTTTSKAAMAKKINELQQVVTTQHQQLEEQKANMAKQDAKIAAQENEIKELKAIMQQILAK